MFHLITWEISYVCACGRVATWLMGDWLMANGQWSMGDSHYKEKGTSDLITSPKVCRSAGVIRIASLLFIAVAES